MSKATGTVEFKVRMTPPLKRDAKALAALWGVSLNGLIVGLIAYAVTGKKQKQDAAQRRKEPR